MHVSVYIQNNYTQCAQIYYVKHKLLFWMRLLPINRLTALVSSVQ